MKAVIELKELNNPNVVDYSSLESGFYKVNYADGCEFIVVGKSTWSIFAFDLIESYIEDQHKPPMTLNEIAASEEEEQDTVPAWFVLELVKTLK